VPSSCADAERGSKRTSPLSTAWWSVGMSRQPIFWKASRTPWIRYGMKVLSGPRSTTVPLTPCGTGIRVFWEA